MCECDLITFSHALLMDMNGNPQDLVLFDLFSALQDAGVIRSVITGSRLYSEVPIGE